MGRHRKEQAVTYEDLMNNISEQTETDIVVDAAISSIPSWETCYCKIYKQRPLPPGAVRPVLIDEVMDLHGITDIETHVRKMAQEHDWGSGAYLVSIFQRKASGEKREVKNLPIEISYEPKQPPQQQTVVLPPIDFKTQLKENTEFLKNTKELVKEFIPQPATNTSEITKAQIDAFNSGLNAANNNQSSSLDIVEIIKALKELGAISPQPKQETSLLDVIKLLRESGLINQPINHTGDLYDQIAKMKAAGLVKLPGEEKQEDTVSQVSKVVEMVSAISSIAGGLGGEKISPTIELIRVLGPQIPKIVESITGTINQVAEVSKMKISAKMGVKPKDLKLIEKQNLTAAQQPTQPKRNEEVINPLIQKLLDAVEKNNTEFFPELKNLMTIYIGPHIFNVLSNGDVPIDEFLNSFSSLIKEPNLSNEKVQSYLKNFIDWINKDKIYTKCTGCGEEYEFDTEEDFKADEKLCECGKHITRV